MLLWNKDELKKIFVAFFYLCEAFFRNEYKINLIYFWTCDLLHIITLKGKVRNGIWFQFRMRKLEYFFSDHNKQVKAWRNLETMNHLEFSFLLALLSRNFIKCVYTEVFQTLSFTMMKSKGSSINDVTVLGGDGVNDIVTT